MIVKGNARGGGAQLAAHLMNAHDNERVELIETRGSVANDVPGAFAEWHAQSKATNCEKYLYSLSINPDQDQGRMERADYLVFLDRVEEKLGLSRQGRIVVFHEKRDCDGELREHCHAVWSRIDARACRAIQLSHDRMKLREVARDFAHELGRKLPPGMEKDKGSDRHSAREAQSNLQERQQEERSGISKQERRAAITRAWKETQDGKGFAAAIEEAGYVLARGDKRAYLLVDRAGEPHSLSRQIDGARAKDIVARLESSHPVSSLPSLEEAKASAAERREAMARFAPASDMPSAMTRRSVLSATQLARRVQLSAERARMEKRQTEERADLAAAQRLTVQFAQSKGRPRRIAAFVQRTATKVHQRHQVAVLERRHKAEAREIARQERHLTALDKRETRSLEIKLQRDSFQTVIREVRRKEASLRTPPGIKPAPAIQRSPSLQHLPTMPAAERQVLLRQQFRPSLAPVAAQSQERIAKSDPDAPRRELEQQRLAEQLRRQHEQKLDR